CCTCSALVAGTLRPCRKLKAPVVPWMVEVKEAAPLACSCTCTSCGVRFTTLPLNQSQSAVSSRTAQLCGSAVPLTGCVSAVPPTDCTSVARFCDITGGFSAIGSAVSQVIHSGVVSRLSPMAVVASSVPGDGG